MSDQRIVFTNPDGSVGVEIPSSSVPFANVLAMVKERPSLTNIRQITTAELPQDRVFREAWDDSNPEYFVGIDVTKAKKITHKKRKDKRKEEFAPHDEVVLATVLTNGPTQNAAEAERVKIRIKYDRVQVEIDDAADEATLRAIITTEDL